MKNEVKTKGAFDMSRLVCEIKKCISILLINKTRGMFWKKNCKC